MKTMQAVLAKPGEDAKIVIIPNVYEAVRDAVGGMITVVRLGEIVLYVHDEALCERLPWNRFLVHVVECSPEAVLVDRNHGTYIAGNVLAVGAGPEGEDRGLTEEEVAFVLSYLNVMCRRLAPTPSSVEELEELTGQPAVGFASTREEAEALGIDADLIDRLWPKKEG